MIKQEELTKEQEEYARSLVDEWFQVSRRYCIVVHLPGGITGDYNRDFNVVNYDNDERKITLERPIFEAYRRFGGGTLGDGYIKRTYSTPRNERVKAWLSKGDFRATAPHDVKGEFEGLGKLEEAARAVVIAAAQGAPDEEFSGMLATLSETLWELDTKRAPGL